MKAKPENTWQRPQSLAEAVARAETTADIGDNLEDFLDHANRLVKQRATRRKLAAAIRREPPRTDVAAQDAYLAAVAAHLANTLRLPSPRWADKPGRRLKRPWFALPDAWTRAWLLRDSPAAFRERNLFTEESPLRRA
jgi:hypothetical protein